MKMFAFVATSVLIGTASPIAASAGALDLDTTQKQQRNQTCDLWISKCPLVGVWHGHIHDDAAENSITFEIKMVAKEVQGTLTCIGKEGTSLHYLRGQFDAETKTLVCRDTGLDIEWGAPGWYPKPIESYSLQLVADDRKLVGTAKQMNNTLWVAATREQRTSSSIQPEAEATQPPKAPIALPRNQAAVNQPTTRDALSTTSPKIAGTWSGVGRGNDPFFKITFELTQNESKVSGVVTMESKSGSSKRYISGFYRATDGDFTCKDLGFANSTPAKGSEFCLIDQYTLRITDSGKHITGMYESIPCHDKATFSLANGATDQDIASIAADSALRASDDKSRGKITPEVASYMTQVDKQIKSHWHLPKQYEVGTIKIRFFINRDGTACDITGEDGTAQRIDARMEAAMNAVKEASPFAPPSQAILDASRVNNGDQVAIAFSFDYKHRKSSALRTALPLMLWGRGAIIFPVS